MWSSGGAILAEVVVCIAAIGCAVRCLHRELEPTHRAFDLLRRDVAEAVTLVSRDAGRAEAGHGLLRRTGNPPASR